MRQQRVIECQECGLRRNADPSSETGQCNASPQHFQKVLPTKFAADRQGTHARDVGLERADVGIRGVLVLGSLGIP
jgi:hypothetical protein